MSSSLSEKKNRIKYTYMKIQKDCIRYIFQKFNIKILKLVRLFNKILINLIVIYRYKLALYRPG